MWSAGRRALYRRAERDERLTQRFGARVKVRVVAQTVDEEAAVAAITRQVHRMGRSPRARGSRPRFLPSLQFGQPLPGFGHLATSSGAGSAATAASA